MKALICSDSHGLTNELIKLKEQHSDVDYLIHCGDSELESHHPAIQGFHIVRGNCDYDRQMENDIVVQAGNDKIFVTHGHLYNVKSGLMNVYYKAIENKATVACFGHSHVLGFEMINGILFINPGSLRLPRMRNEKTYVILEITDSEKIVKVYEYGKGEILTERFVLEK